MADANINNNDFFLGLMVLKNEKWTPHSKFDGGAFGTALISAEDVDKLEDYDAVKIVRIPIKSGAGDQKEMWVSPRLAARTKAQAANQLRDGLKKSQANLKAERQANARK